MPLRHPRMVTAPTPMAKVPTKDAIEATTLASARAASAARPWRASR